MIRLQTERLMLTSMLPEHEAELYTLHNDPLVQASIFENIPQSHADVKAKLELYLMQWRKNGFGFWMVYEKRSNAPVFIGRAGLRDFGESNDLEFGYVFLSAGAGRGLGVEAARVTIDHALRFSTKDKIVGVIAPGNERAVRAAAKIGFRYIDDRWHDGKFWHYFEMTRAEFFQWPSAPPP